MRALCVVFSACMCVRVCVCVCVCVLGQGAVADITAWPEFHNGVAAALRLVSVFESGSGSGSSTRARGGVGSLGRCLVPPLPEAPSFSHAGQILALGMTGHLSRLAWTDVYRYACVRLWVCLDTPFFQTANASGSRQYLTEQHDATTMATMCLQRLHTLQCLYVT